MPCDTNIRSVKKGYDYVSDPRGYAFRGQLAMRGDVQTSTRIVAQCWDAP